MDPQPKKDPSDIEIQKKIGTHFGSSFLRLPFECQEFLTAVAPVFLFLGSFKPTKFLNISLRFSPSKKSCRFLQELWFSDKMGVSPIVVAFQIQPFSLRFPCIFPSKKHSEGFPKTSLRDAAPGSASCTQKVGKGRQVATASGFWVWVSRPQPRIARSVLATDKSGQIIATTSFRDRFPPKGSFLEGKSPAISGKSRLVK